MSTRKKEKLAPTVPLTLVTSSGRDRLSPSSITRNLVGEKAYGLACLPAEWTLPFIVISSSLLEDFRASRSASVALSAYAEHILGAMVSEGFGPDDFLIVRSSGCKEGLFERGRFYSVNGCVNDFVSAVSDCLQRLADDLETADEQVPIIIQKRPKAISAKGHLSNERRWYKDGRDWLGQYDGKNGKPYFTINLRNWRRKLTFSNALDKRLQCNLKEQVPEILKVPAAWSCQHNERVHFEWIWDGSVLFIVQADPESDQTGINPTKIHTKTKGGSEFHPRCLIAINDSHATHYHKVRNVLTYQQLDLPVAKLYVIDDQKIIQEIATGVIREDLRRDIEEMVKKSLVIRVDVDIKDKERLQLLPRTHEVRDLQAALSWLKEKSFDVKRFFPENDIIFLFHNFIPAVSSAFCYAVPGQRKVQIEALWGLPEGLYYNSHDKYVVDTLKSNLFSIKDADFQNFGITSRPRCKLFCVVPDRDGKWLTQPVASSYQWRESIQERKWVKEIAFHSRRIAEMEQRPLSIMWFVGVPPNVCAKPIFPWFHETLDAQLTTKAATQRAKTPFDITFPVRTSEDLERLRREAEGLATNIRMIRIQPTEEALLRSKSTLRDIGELAKKIDAIILLEGGILSHAYYQLMQTEATIEVLNPFETPEEKREFYKLVRDKVPANIAAGGENVRTAKLKGSSLLRALREKLVEEAFEALDADDQNGIIGELADVAEVVDSILKILSCSREDLRLRQDEKRSKAGGFSDGIVLLDTSNPALIKVDDNTSASLFSDNEEPHSEVSIRPHEIHELANLIHKWTDRRDHSAAKEVVVKVNVPFVRDSWSSSAPEVIIDADDSTVVRAELNGKRRGSRIELQLSIYQLKQGKLFDKE